jgi:endonuclease/exonuclease/phosphatase (EEP) superfamily protein YafD
MAAGFGFDPGLHADAWAWLKGQRPDVALLQEVVTPTDEEWGNVIHSRKYANSPVVWGSAVLTSEPLVRSYEATFEYPWLSELGGSVCVGQPGADGAPWLVSIHSNAYPLSAERLAGRQDRVARRCHPEEIWEVEAIAQDLEGLLRGERFIVGGDLNSSLLFDEVNRYDFNKLLFENLTAAGFVDTRPRFSAAEVQTYYKPNRRPYQLDHVYADPVTEASVTSWRVDPSPVQLGLSDHAPIILDI